MAQMENKTLSFGEAFDRDLKTYDLEQSTVCELLSVNDAAPITSAAISNWKRRGAPPLNRLEQLVEIFGQSSETAAFHSRLLTEQVGPDQDVIAFKRKQSEPFRELSRPGRRPDTTSQENANSGASLGRLFERLPQDENLRNLVFVKCFAIIERYLPGIDPAPSHKHGEHDVPRTQDEERPA